MARITHVAAAKQRYETVPVLDENGEQKRTPVMRNGEQRKTKHGALVFMNVTERDLTKPLDPETCDFCKKPIEIGTSYKHVSPRSGPYGGRKRSRHESCPTWHSWELSNSLSARLEQISHDFWDGIDSVETPDDVSTELGAAAERIRELAEEKREGANNIEEGFGHPTSQSEELESTADELESWADEIESADVPDLPEPEEDDCPECQGTGQLEVDAAGDESSDETEECSQCGGSGQETPDDPTDEQIEQWRQDLQDQLTVVDESPV